MELRDFVNIFLKQKKVLLSIIVGSMCVGLFVFALQVSSVSADLTLNIARAGVQNTTDYRYDGSYRLQADERFSDTVVQWLASPRILSDIASESKVQLLNAKPWYFGGAVRAERLSSQVVRVSYRATNAGEADRWAKGLLSVLNQDTRQLNSTADDESWFTVQGEAPVVQDGRFGWLTALGVSAFVGVFVAFWVGLFRYYWKKR